MLLAYLSDYYSDLRLGFFAVLSVFYRVDGLVSEVKWNRRICALGRIRLARDT